MKSIFACMIVLATALATSPQGLSQTSLEQQLQRVFLSEHANLNEVAQLGRGEDVQAVLSNMMERYKYAEPGTKEYRLLGGATRALGIIEARRGITPLSQVLFDQKVHENIRADAARSLGQIDAEGNKQALLKALETADHYLTRVYAAESLAKTKDTQALRALERYSREERDSFVRQKFEKAAQEIKARIGGGR